MRTPRPFGAILYKYDEETQSVKRRGDAVWMFEDGKFIVSVRDGLRDRRHADPKLVEAYAAFARRMEDNPFEFDA